MPCYYMEVAFNPFQSTLDSDGLSKLQMPVEAWGVALQHTHYAMKSRYDRKTLYAFMST